MKIELLNMTIDPVWNMCKASDMSYNTNHKDCEKIIKKIIKLGHVSVLEHAHATFKISGVSRTFSHQIVRHRYLSIVQRSQRYVDENRFFYVIPPSICDDVDAMFIFDDLMDHICDVYKTLRDLGIKKEDARFVLPNACTTEMVITANLREWKYIIQLRGEKSAQWEIRNFSIKLLEMFKILVPVVFEDLEVDKENNVVKVIK